MCIFRAYIKSDIYSIYEIITVFIGFFNFFSHQINALNIHNLNITLENDPKARKKKIKL